MFCGGTDVAGAVAMALPVKRPLRRIRPGRRARKTERGAAVGWRPRIDGEKKSKPPPSAEREGPLLLLGHDRLHRRGRAAGELDVDHVGADLVDRLFEADLAAVDA